MNAKTIVPFHVYEASAGAGKTFLLVQKYLIKLLSNKHDSSFQRMLALTFTNKAVYEMKSRILSQLHFIANEENITADPMGNALLVDLNIPPHELKKRAESTLQLLLHDYAAFDVITLDSFTHRVIRTFAKDLGLSYTFEVELQTDRILEGVVHQVMDMVGKDKELTRLLEAYTFQKMDDESVTSWDLKSSLLDSARLLLNENNRDEINRFTTHIEESKKDHYEWLLGQRDETKKALVELGKQAVSFLKENNLSAEYFNRKTLYNRFLNLSKANFNRYDAGKLHQNLIDGKAIYTTKTPKEAKEKIDELLPQLLEYYENGLKLFYRWQLLVDILKQWVPLNLLSLLAKTLEDFQNETNRVLLSTFNERISKEILWQPSPYIYERLGENYQHYFIDEFQDTSVLQWKNLIPLIKSSVESQAESDSHGSLLLVGDPKQSIYRWRGGNVEQFIDLIGTDNPFTIKKEVDNLPSNYRSANEIVRFNNSLFHALTGHLTHELNQTLYGDRAVQEIKNTSGGYVRVEFLDVSNKDDHPYARRIIQDVNNCLGLGYALEQMAILVRTRKQAQSIAIELTQNNIPYVSSESLVLSQSASVNFLLSLLYLYVQPNNLEKKKVHLEHLFGQQKRTIGLHEYLQNNLSRSLNVLWAEENINFDLNWFDQRGIYAVLQEACAHFGSLEMNDAFIVSFLDEVFDFSLQEVSDISTFLDYWEQLGQNKTLASSETENAIKLMTIHQAKGLEFPIVFFPYADRQIHPRHRDRLWLDTSSNFGDNLPLAWISNSERLKNYGKTAEKLFQNKLREEEIDAWNIFYVATTRAIEQLYIYADKEQITKETYAAFLADFVKTQEQTVEDDIFEWGKLETKLGVGKNVEIRKSERRFFSIYPYEKKLLLQRNTSKKQEQARWQGIKIHDLVSRIRYADEIGGVLEEAVYRGEISLKEKNKMEILFESMVNSPKIAAYFKRNVTVLNEQSIVVPKSKILRPDRIVIDEDKIIVIDYKTGERDQKHLIQIKDYSDQTAQIFNRTVSAFLVYLKYNSDNQINIVEVV